MQQIKQDKDNKRMQILQYMNSVIVRELCESYTTKLKYKIIIEQIQTN